MEVPGGEGAATNRTLNGAPGSSNGRNLESARDAKESADAFYGSINRDVYDIGDTFNDLRGAPPTHWSVTWSDLMMTMFILFMTLYIYQMANRSLLEKDQALNSLQQDSPFYIPGSDYASGEGDTIATIERAQDEDPSLLVEGKLPRELSPERLPAVQQRDGAGLEAEVTASWKGSPTYQQPGDELIPSTDLKTPKEVPQPEERPEVLSKLFDLSQYTLAQEKLQHFASVEVVPDKAVRIILTGDLLFPSGQAILTGAAEDALSRLAPVLRRIPYMVNVVGHTDSTPMYSAQYPSNWELSVARASSVARFLMDEMELPGRQLVVSGYAFYRPVRPNNSIANRASNRRVEIIISKELPAAVPLTEANLR
jgi:chemotaxis protein MotB